MMKPSDHTRMGGVAKALLALSLVFGVAYNAQAELIAPKPAGSQGSFAGYITLRWSAVQGAVAYLIKRNTANDMNSAINIAVADQTTLTDDYRIKPGMQYYYWVCPVDSNYNVWGNASKAGTGSARKLTAAMLKITATDGTSTAAVVLKFKNVAEAQVYGIYRSPTKDFGDGELIGAFENDRQHTSWTINDNTAIPGKKYYYWLVVLTGSDNDFNGYEFHFDAAKDIGWRRIVLQLYTPYFMALSNTSTIYCWTLRRNGTSVAASKVTATCSPKNCSSVIRYSTPDDDGFSGEFAPKKVGKVYFSAKQGSLTVKSKNVTIIKNSTLVSTVYGK